MSSLVVVYLAFIAVLGALGVPWGFIAVIAGVMLAFQYYGSDKLVLRSLHAKVVTAEEEPHLHTTIERLAAQAEMPMPKIAVAHTDIPNAFATGRNPKNSVICVTDGIRRRLTDDELEAVLAHELTHVKNRDVTVMTLASFFATVAAMLMQMLMWMSIFGGMSRGGGRGGGGAAAAFMLAYVASVLVYFIATLLILALSRYREYSADRGGAILVGAPSRLASALSKMSGSIARIPTDDLRKMETANAFFIVSALKGESLAGLFSSHPPMDKRLERLRRLQIEMEGR